jgi:hypothetical protein
LHSGQRRACGNGFKVLAQEIGRSGVAVLFGLLQRSDGVAVDAGRAPIAYQRL